MIGSRAKYWFLPALFFLFLNSGFTQTVYFDQQVFDFNLIHENNGSVFHEFKITNKSEKAYKIKGIINSCGCTSVEISSDSILQGKTIRMRAGYDPANRPGNFFKQVTIVLQNGSTDTLAIDAYLKGTVISKNDVNFSPINLKNATIQIKPVMVKDEKDLEGVSFNSFVNDLTIVIDKDKFANVKIDYFQHDLTAVQRIEKLKFIKQKIVAALKIRGYGAYPVGFTDTIIRTLNDTLPKQFFAILRSANYNKDGIKYSNVMVNGLKDLSNTQFSNDSTSIRYTLNVPNPQEKIDWTVSKPQDFVAKLVRTVLMTGNATLGIYVKGLFKSAEEPFIKRTLDPQIKNLYAELEAQGIEFSKLTVLPPVFLKGDVYEMSYNIIEYSVSNSAVSWNDFQFHLDSIRKASLAKSEYENSFKNNVPVYYQRVENQNEFDTTNFQFKEWFNLFKSSLKANKKLSIIIEATASNAPTTKQYDNAFVARRRANTAMNNLISYFDTHGIRNGKQLFKDPYALVKGPLYDETDFIIQHYKKYQYIKLIPVETDSLVQVNTKQIPYQINFSNNDFSLPTGSVLYQNFIDNLIPSIKKFGYVELILESSASKVPTTNYNSNRVLAFERLQKAKDEILKSIAQKGYNPLRVIFTDERILVQGPAFKQGMDSQNPMYKEYQYIKIIPKSFVNR